MANLTAVGLISTALRRVYNDQLRTWINNSRITYFQGVTIMAGNIYTWSVTAADNDDADPAINWVEGQAPGTVNNSARGVMSGVACFIKDNNGSISSAGISTAYTATVNTPITALVTGLRITLKIHLTNTGASTLTVTSGTGASLGSKAIRIYTAGTETDTIGGQLVASGPYQFIYDSAANGASGAWICLNPTLTYKEGTFTPGISFGGGATGITYTTQQAVYTKVGRLVVFSLKIVINSHGSSTGAARITGLPFTSEATQLHPVALRFLLLAMQPDDVPQGHVNAGATTIDLEVNNSSADVLPMDDTSLTDGCTIECSGQYIV